MFVDVALDIDMLWANYRRRPERVCVCGGQHEPDDDAAHAGDRDAAREARAGARQSHGDPPEGHAADAEEAAAQDAGSAGLHTRE